MEKDYSERLNELSKEADELYEEIKNNLSPELMKKVKDTYEKLVKLQWELGEIPSKERTNKTYETQMHIEAVLNAKEASLLESLLE